MNFKNTLKLSRISLFSIIFCAISSIAYADKGGNGNGNNGNGGGNGGGSASVSSPEPSAILTFFVLAGVVLIAKRRDEIDKFLLRHSLRKHLGLNRDFLGTGYTLDKNTNEPGVAEYLHLTDRSPGKK